MLVIQHLFTFLKGVFPLNTTLCMLLIRSYRGQHWKGKQTEILKKKWKKSNGVQLTTLIKYQKQLVTVKNDKLQVLVLLNIIELVYEICTHFQWRPLCWIHNIIILTNSLMNEFSSMSLKVPMKFISRAVLWMNDPGNTKGRSITVPLTSRLTGLD